jgi:sortase A
MVIGAICVTKYREGLSHLLIEQAWSRTQSSTEASRPWPWAAGMPVAKIIIPELKQEHIIMNGVSDRILELVPGWHEGTDFPGKPGISLISARRDTHFAFLRKLKEGDSFFLETQEGKRKLYYVSELSVVQDKKIKVQGHDNESILLLSTSYSFQNWHEDEELRLVIIARESKSKDSGVEEEDRIATGADADMIERSGV